MSIQHRAIVDGTVTFLNGGSIVVEGFRLDLPDADAAPEQAGALLLSALGLLLADDVTIASLEVAQAAHQ